LFLSIKNPRQTELAVATSLSLAHVANEVDTSLGDGAMSNRDWYKYHYKIGNKIRHSGITQDLERREQEHQRRWPGGHIVQVGRATTEEAAREWEETKHKAITPRRK
jgi:predicted GIY-YIG superfamily endonuclease